MVGAFSPDSRTLSSSDADGSVVLWDVRRGARDRDACRAHPGEASNQVFSPDGRTLYTASADPDRDHLGRRRGSPTGEGRLPDRDTTGKTSRGSRTRLRSPSAPTGNSSLSQGSTGRESSIDAETLRTTRPLEAFGNRPAVAIEYSPDGRRLAVGSVMWRSRSVGRGLREAARPAPAPPPPPPPAAPPAWSTPHDAPNARCSVRETYWRAPRWAAPCGYGT